MSLIFTNSSPPLTDDSDSPELPEFCTRGYKIKMAERSSDPAAQIFEKPESSNLHEEMATTPTFPEPKSQYLKQLVTAKRVRSLFQHRSRNICNRKRDTEQDAPVYACCGRLTMMAMFSTSRRPLEWGRSTPNSCGNTTYRRYPSPVRRSSRCPSCHALSRL